MSRPHSTSVRSTDKVPNRCSQCRSSIHLKPRWCSDTDNLWIECTHCGNISEPQITDDLKLVVETWNEENPV